MFGYVLPEKPELKIREYELFRAYYCGLCKNIAKRYGQLPRFVLNYDMTFLAVLLSSLDDSPEVLKKSRCFVHPGKKRMFVFNCEALDYAADMNIILAYYNIDDNWKDTKSLLSAAGKAALYLAFKKVRKRHEEKCKFIEERLFELSALETEGCNSLDRATEPFATLIEEITAFRPLCKDDNQEKIMRWFGYNLGKWIYVLDAYDDIENDIKRKSYNPLVCQHRLKNEEPSELKQRIRERVRFTVTYSLNEISKAFELLDVKKNRNLLDNIIYMGMLRKSEQILSTRSCESIEKSL